MAQTINEYLRGLPDKISLNQAKAQARRPFQTRSIGRQAKHLSKNAKPWMMWDIDETVTQAMSDKSAALKKVIDTPGGIKIRSWTPWQKYLKHDVVEPEMAALFRQQKAAGTHNMAFLTARSERARSVTSKWLAQEGLSPDLLLMRPLDKANEKMSTAPFKTSMLDRYLPGAEISHFYDDTGSVIEAMAARGIPGTTVIPKKLEVAERLVKRGGGTNGRLMHALMAARAVVGRYGM